ncbi:UPF0149 family protein [Aliidiomarina sp. Khilg15.8]
MPHSLEQEPLGLPVERLKALVHECDEIALPSMQAELVTHALPFYDAPFIYELDSLIGDAQLSTQRRLVATQLLQAFTAMHPQVYGTAVSVLGARLQDFTSNPACLNGALVDAAQALQAKELLPVVKAAFADNAVDNPEYADATDFMQALAPTETSFEQGLQDFMHDKELEEIRAELDTRFAALPEDVPVRSVSELDGLLHAVSVCARPVGRSQWQGLLSPGILEDMTAPEASELLDKLTAYQQEVKDGLASGDPAPYVDPYEVQHLASIRPWARGFLLGAALWHDADAGLASEDAAVAEFIEFIEAMAADREPPAQYQVLANSDFTMIMTLMLQRVYMSMQGGEEEVPAEYNDLDDENPMQAFFAQFGDGEQD